MENFYRIKQGLCFVMLERNEASQGGRKGHVLLALCHFAGCVIKDENMLHLVIAGIIVK